MSKINVHGVRSNTLNSNNRERTERWLKPMIERCGKKIVAIALANKMVRTAVALTKTDSDYQSLPIQA